MRYSSFRLVLLGVFSLALVLALSGIAVGGVPEDGLESSLPAEQVEILQYKARGHRG